MNESQIEDDDWTFLTDESFVAHIRTYDYCHKRRTDHYHSVRLKDTYK